MLQIDAIKGQAASLKPWAWVVILVVLAYKIYACFQVPAVTSDVLRHLGYTSHALDSHFTIYNTVAQDFRPEPWTKYWGKQPYIYPPTTLLFFYTFSAFHLGIFWVKATLTLIDFICTYLFYKHISKLAAFLFFCAPISLWYTSHEGQFEILQTLFIILNAIAIRKRQWRFAGFWLAISLQVKQFGILILPWMLYEMWMSQKEESQGLRTILSKTLQGLALGFLPFLPFYIQTPHLLFLPITNGATRTYNPFAWNVLREKLFGWNPPWLILWNALFSYIPLALLLITGLQAWRKQKFATSVAAAPLTSFWLITKSLRWGQFWYPIVAPGFLFCLTRKSLIHLLLALHLMQCLHSAVAIVYQPIGYRERQHSIALMRSCMFTCDPQHVAQQS